VILRLTRPTSETLRALLAQAGAGPLTYDGDGPGFHHLQESIDVGPAAAFERARRKLLSFGLHRDAGLAIETDGPVAVGTNVVLAARVFPLHVVAACRIVAVTDEPGRVSWSYGTLRLHPECGEETFELAIERDRTVFSVRAFSRPGHPLVRAVGPVSRLLQRRATHAYLRAMQNATWAGATAPRSTSWTPAEGSPRPYEATVRIGSGTDLWEMARERVLSWEIKRRSGFDVPTGPIRPDDVVELNPRLGRFGRWRLREPVRVTEVVDEVDRAGFSYETLRGHPVSGEEAFIVHRVADEVSFTLRSVTAPGSQVWRALFPLVRAIQPLYRRRYMKAMTSLQTGK
jgi:uncharacterized protein (UPF0548 family)